MSWFPVDNYDVNVMRGGCLICANNTPRILAGGRRERILSSSYQDEFLGTPQICETCIEEGARLVDMVSGRRFKALEDQLKAALEVIEAEKSHTEDKEATIRTLTRELASAQAAPVPKKNKVSAK